MDRLHGSDHAQAGQPADVGFGHRFQVFDPVPAIARTVDAVGLLKGVQRDVGGLVADGMQGDLPISTAVSVERTWESLHQGLPPFHHVGAAPSTTTSEGLMLRVATPETI
jgi:hypothetical protein